METIFSATGSIVSQSKNLAGIHRYVGKNTIASLAIKPLPDPKYPNAQNGRLHIRFVDGSHFTTEFASYEVLKMHVRQWRNVYGAPLIVDGVDAGTVSSKNEALQDTPAK